MSNSYERMFDELLKGPQTIQRLKRCAGMSVRTRIYEFNKVHGKVMEIKVSNGVAQLVRHTRIKVDHKKAYPSYYDDKGYVYNPRRRSSK